MADWDDYEEHAAAVAEAEAWQAEQDYQHELAIADYFDDLEASGG